MLPFFGPNIGEDQEKKDPRGKISGFLLQMRLETKVNEKTRSSPQPSGVMVSYHNMVSPGASRPPPPFSLAMPLQKMITRQEFDYKLRKFTALMKSFEKARITACYHILKVTDIFVKLNRMQCKKQKG